LLLSVCLSIVYIANNSRTQRPSVPKFGMKVPHLKCNSHTRPNPAATLPVFFTPFYGRHQPVMRIAQYQLVMSVPVPAQSLAAGMHKLVAN